MKLCIVPRWRRRIRHAKREVVDEVCGDLRSLSTLPDDGGEMGDLGGEMSCTVMHATPKAHESTSFIGEETVNKETAVQKACIVVAGPDNIRDILVH
jgi:hypothetical protein